MVVYSRNPYRMTCNPEVENSQSHWKLKGWKMIHFSSFFPDFLGNFGSYFQEYTCCLWVSGTETSNTKWTWIESWSISGAPKVRMRIFVADNGFTSFLQGNQEEPKTFIQDLIIDVKAVNDMPYLYWVNLPPKDRGGDGFCLVFFWGLGDEGGVKILMFGCSMATQL